MRGSFRSSAHVAVQLGVESQAIAPEAFQEYLELYLGADAVNIYWGTPEHFLARLSKEIAAP
jgi:hypothetical protein